jgi:hypothetical protein
MGLVELAARLVNVAGEDLLGVALLAGVTGMAAGFALARIAAGAPLVTTLALSALCLVLGTAALGLGDVHATAWHWSLLEATLAITTTAGGLMSIRQTMRHGDNT